MQRYCFFSIYTNPQKLSLYLRSFTQLFYIIIWKNNPSSSAIAMNLMDITKKETTSISEIVSPTYEEKQNRLTNLLRLARHRNPHTFREQISLRRVAHKRSLPNLPNQIREHPHPNSSHQTAHCPRSTPFQ